MREILHLPKYFPVENVRNLYDFQLAWLSLTTVFLLLLYLDRLESYIPQIVLYLKCYAIIIVGPLLVLESHYIP